MSEKQAGVAAEGRLQPGDHQRITPKEKEILCLIAGGLTDQQIAQWLWVSIHTVHTHLAHLREKFQVPNRVALVREAQRLGYIPAIPERSPFIAIGESQSPGYTQGQDAEPKLSREERDGEASADLQGETEMLNRTVRLYYLAALLATGTQPGSAADKATESTRTPRVPAPSAAADANGEAGGMVARRVWAGPKLDFFLSPSSDGRYLSFVDWDTGDLALRDLATGKSRRLTNKGSWSDSSEWALYSTSSPDGKQVAYVWYNKDAYFDLRLIGRDGARPRVLYRDEKAGWLHPVDWSKDGKQILAFFYRQVAHEPKGGATQIVLVSVADGSTRVLKTLDRGYPGKLGDGGWPGNMVFSPDGRTIAYTYPSKTDAPERDIFLLANDGSRETPLVQHPANDTVLGWAPDGKSLLFASDRTGTQGIWRARIADGKPEGAPELVKREMGAWSPLGLTRKGALFYGVKTGMVDVYTAPLDPGTGQVLTPPQPANPRLGGSNNSPAWSPDGRHLAYLSPERDLLRARDYPHILSIRSVDNGETREIPLKRSVNQPIWSPDGRSLLTSGEDREGRRGAFRIDAQTGAVTAIAEPGGIRPGGGVWAPDGKAIFYRANDGDAHLLKVRDLETGQEKELYRAPIIRGGALAVSPDSRKVAFVAEYDGYRISTIKVMPAAGGEPHELFRVREEDTSVKITSLAWMPDGRDLLFSRGKSGQAVEVWRIPVAGGEPQRVGLAMQGLRSLSVHPDGRRIAFTAGLPEVEIWALENLFPAAQTAKAPAPRR